MTDLPPLLPSDEGAGGGHVGVNQEPDDELDDAWHDKLLELGDTFGARDVTAVVAFVLALCSLFSFSLLNGTTYVIALVQNLTVASTTELTMATLLGAGLALIPVGLGWRAEARSLPDDPRWVVVLARAAIILGLTSGLLRLVVAVVQAAHGAPTGFTRL